MESIYQKYEKLLAKYKINVENNNPEIVDNYHPEIIEIEIKKFNTKNLSRIIMKRKNRMPLSYKWVKFKSH